MENTCKDNVKLKNLDIFNFWLENDRKPNNVINWISAKFNRSVNDNCMTTVKNQINKTNGSGSTNDGNTARKAFSNPELFSSITNINIDFLKHLHIILITINSEFEISGDHLKKFCGETADIYFKNYEWYPMSATLHKILAHSYQILQASIVPLGCAGEHASEARNKFYKKDRMEHARKDSREHNIMDVFNRALDSSDPLLSSIYLKNRLSKKRSLQLPREVISLLKIPEIHEYQLPSTSNAAINKDISYSEEDEEESFYFNFELEVDESEKCQIDS